MIAKWNIARNGCWILIAYWILNILLSIDESSSRDEVFTSGQG